MYLGESSDYFTKNPLWHIADSPWKARLVFEMIQKHQLIPKKIAEIGCGAGEILNQLYDLLPADVSFSGFDISQDAIKLARSREKDRLTFINEDMLERQDHFDLLLVMDVIEHVENYFEFIRKCRTQSDYTLFHIPLDLSVLSMLRNSFYYARERVGHIHYFTKDTALLTLQDCGYEIIDWSYNSLNLYRKPYSPKTLYRNICKLIVPDFTVRLFGAYSLLVLAK
jgi:SAM-dependent methyltransferase